ncbi:MAG: 1-deoxy-D-xylulose-5-phosphate reductoisomerase [bacterium]|nr:1-deoxy-D-xylulose-5-phosphate reductoisomerase [bacterium]
MRRIAVLGCTGSIGSTTFRVLEGLRQQDGQDAWVITVLTAGRRVDELIRLAQQWQPQLVCVADAAAAEHVRHQVHETCRVVHGAAGLCAAVTDVEVDVVVNGLVGAVGLEPTLAAVSRGLSVAMANKEPLVMAGGLVLDAAAAGGGRILPVDSEPSAMWQCLNGERPQDVRRYLLTASGGAFRDRSRHELAAVTPQQALHHPTWSMGPKITVDCATLMNKGFEVIEAGWLFGVGVDQVDVVMHRESIVHSMVEFVDGSVLAHLGRTDMAIPIQYALTHPARRRSTLSALDVVRLGALHFEAPDLTLYPGLALCYDVGRAGGTTPAALNAANEVAVAAFLDGSIGFLDIHTVNQAVVDDWDPVPATDVGTVLVADLHARQLAQQVVDSCRVTA